MRQYEENIKKRMRARNTEKHARLCHMYGLNFASEFTQQASLAAF
jgi:hypothetical protein